MKTWLSSLFLVFLLAGTASAAAYGGIGGKPAHPDPNDPRTKSWFIYTLGPGQSISDELLVQNSSDETVNVFLYPADSTASTDGGFALEQKAEPRDFVGKWVTLSESELTLAPRESRIIPFTLTVPDDSRLDVGEHTGGILIQKAVPASEGEGGLKIQTRVGVRIYVTIPGEKVEKLEIESVHVILNEETNSYAVRTILKNSGNVSQNVTVHTRVVHRSPSLASALRELQAFPLEDSKNLQVLRGDRLASAFEFPKPRWGMLDVQVRADYGAGSALIADLVKVRVPLDRTIMTLFLLSGALFISCFALFILRQYSTVPLFGKRRRY